MSNSSHKVYQDGVKAFKDGKDRSDNPYNGTKYLTNAYKWDAGYCAGKFGDDKGRGEAEKESLVRVKRWVEGRNATQV